MPDLSVSQRAAQAGLSITVTRVNGVVEEWGLVSYRCRNPIKQGIVEALIERGDRLPKAWVMRASVLDLVKVLLKGNK